MKRKGMARTTGMVIALLVVVVVVLPFIISFKSFAASPADQADTSQVILVEAIRKVVNEGTGFIGYPYCIKEDIYLPTEYFFKMESVENGCATCGLSLYKETDGDSEWVKGSEIVELEEKGNNICCHTEFDNKKMCNTHCSDPETMIIGKGKSISDEVCICLHGSTVYIYQPAWHEEIRPGWILDDCAKAGVWTL